MKKSSPVDLKEIENICLLKNEKLTPIRRAVLEFLFLKQEPVKAYDLIDAIQLTGKKLTPASIYRTLDFFISLGIVHKISSLNAFVLCTRGQHHKEGCLLLICRLCGRSVEVGDAGMIDYLRATLVAAHFTPSHGNIEIQGVCESCAAQSA